MGISISKKKKDANKLLQTQYDAIKTFWFFFSAMRAILTVTLITVVMAIVLFVRIFFTLSHLFFNFAFLFYVQHTHTHKELAL